MANASQDLVIRMKTDSQNFNEGIEAAKNKVKDFKREGEGAGGSFEKGMKIAKSAIGKIAIAIGAATAAWEAYKSMAAQTQTLSDDLESSISACKDTWAALQREIITGGDVAISHMRELYKEAKKLADLRDSLGTDVLAKGVYGMKYKTIYEEARTEYQEAKKKGDEKAMTIALNKATKALRDYENANKLLIQDSQNSVLKGISNAINGMDLETTNAMEEVLKLSNAQQGQLMGITQTYKKYAEMSKDEARKYFGVLYTNPARYGTAGVAIEPQVPTGHRAARMAMKELGYSDKQIEMAERQYRMSQVPDATYQQIIQDLSQGVQMENEIISMRRGLVKMQEKEMKEAAKNNNKEIHGTQNLIPQLQPRKFSGQINISPNGARPLDEDWVRNEMAKYNLEKLEEEEGEDGESDAEVWAKKAEKVKVYTQAIGGLSNAFSNLASIASDDSPWKKFLTVLSSVGNNIMSLVQTYTSLVAALTAANVIQSGEGIPFPYNLIVMGAAAASITGIIASVVSQTKSQKFAQGGIVGGNNYHDGIRANLSTGEMVLNRNQQARLWNLIISGGAGRTAENVVFKIYGEDLVGVIDNYNKNSNY